MVKRNLKVADDVGYREFFSLLLKISTLMMEVSDKNVTNSSDSYTKSKTAQSGGGTSMAHSFRFLL